MDGVGQSLRRAETAGHRRQPIVGIIREWRRKLAGADAGTVVLHVLGLLVVLGVVGGVLAPVFHDLNTMGGHDWDEMQAQRYLAVKSLLKYHQFPFWNPYACGGFD